LTPDELALYLRIAYHARPPWWLCVAGTEALCDSCLSDKKVRAAKKTLQATKRIKITRRLNQTDQITIVNRVLDHRDVYVPREVVLALRPPELAVYCRIADRDRGTGCKAQNKELAINVCTVRQVANILAKLESNGLIRRYEIDGKRFISSSAYGFKAHATHLAELEKQAAEACNLGGVPRKNQQGTKGNIGGVTPCNFGGDKEVPKNQFPEKEQHGGSPLVGDAKTDNSASNGSGLVPIEVFIRRVMERADKEWRKPSTLTESGLHPDDEAELAAKWERKQAEGYTIADALFCAELIRKDVLKPKNKSTCDYCLDGGMELARQYQPIAPTLAQCVEVLTKRGQIEKQTAPTKSGLPRALEPKWEEQWQQCLREGHTLRDLLKLDLGTIKIPHDVYLGKYLSRDLPFMSGNHQECDNLPGKGCDSVFHWTRDNRILICPRFSGDAAEWGINHWKRDDA
jgi:DNA-binding MarR family transcriptional regulator